MHVLRDIEILENFIYLGTAMQNKDRSYQEVSQQIGSAFGVMDSARVYGIVSIPVQKEKDLDPDVTNVPSLNLWL